LLCDLQDCYHIGHHVTLLSLKYLPPHGILEGANIASFCGLALAPPIDGEERRECL